MNEYHNELNMKHLCYVYIFDYKCLKNIEITLDCHYKYKYEKDNSILTITKNNDFPSDFWGNNIYSVTGIVGNNGSGKSTVMSFLLDFLVEGSACESINGIIVYENNGALYYYGENVEVFYEGNRLNNNKQSMGLRDSLWKIPCFYYSGHFSPYINTDPRNSNLAGCNIASDNILLVEDLQNYYNEDSLRMNLPLERHLNSHIAQNNYRICMMLANKELSKIIHDFAWPRYVIIGVNQSGETAIKNKIRIENLMREKYGQEQIEISIPTFKPCNNDRSSSEYFISLLIYHNLINIINDKWQWQNGFDIVEKWQNAISSDSPILDMFESFVNSLKDDEIKGTLDSLHKMLLTVKKLTIHGTDSFGNNFLYIDCLDHAESLTKLGEEVLNNNEFYLTSKFFDLYYAPSLDAITQSILSSGELEMLNLFSRIYDATVLKPQKFKNINATCMLMLDEAEIGFHPDWQRRYLKLVIDFLDAIKVIFPKLYDFQIIISTHSPILLSDIPRCCTNYLKTVNGSTIKMNSDDIGETFAANVFDLYRMSFFMNDGLVGAFARKKINKLCTRINDGENDGVMNEIQMVGDARIKEYLMEKYHEIHPDDEVLNEDIIKYYEEKIEQLKNKGGVKDE